MQYWTTSKPHKSVIKEKRWFWLAARRLEVVVWVCLKLCSAVDAVVVPVNLLYLSGATWQNAHFAETCSRAWLQHVQMQRCTEMIMIQKISR